ncbi:hypothetical protein HNY73_018411 [Argiope bruennichi]|uniref:PDZ domain-containing protein n=1 Tax=Argiope bruennichi TaxID=94029 RepID=A0A8T0EHR2_ARGBR|nr:hypothetical protein HNY73_018411 [Argiope bruennichi]
MSGGGCFACIVSSRSKDSKRKVNSKGREQGLKEGDRVLSVNGQPTAEMTHADAQRVIRESSSGIELQIERNTANSETNGFCTTQNGSMADGEIVETRLNALDEEVNHAGSWSTDSTSTGSTTIHVSSLNSDDTSASEGGKCSFKCFANDNSEMDIEQFTKGILT